jgi:hypothetical protein
MSKSRIPTVDLFTGSAGALARIPYRGERVERTRFLSVENKCLAARCGRGRPRSQ